MPALRFRDQLRHARVESLGDSPDDLDACRPSASLDQAHIGAVQSGAIGKLLLRETTLLTPLTNNYAKGLRNAPLCVWHGGYARAA
jgi:hypothetical protein